jgi:hypothetical protein
LIARFDRSRIDDLEPRRAEDELYSVKEALREAEEKSAKTIDDEEED